ncbi:MAG TPA: FAD-binding oxidoreductase, partial [Cyanobium sp.]|nr:FAD-binding oxidoreductase [Cyanobium sp.]
MNLTPRQAIEAMLAGMAAGTIVAFTASSLAHAIPGGRGESRQPEGLFTTLAGGGFGAIGGLLLARHRPRGRHAVLGADRLPQSGSTGEWSDWRPFQVVRKVKESEEITSFHLATVDAGPLPRFAPGQFLPIRLEIPGQPRPVIRTYSLSDFPDGDSPSTYRLSIKREPAPENLDVPAGVASNFMHDHIGEGSIIEARPPSGAFVLDLTLPTAAVLISNGVGITPMMAMLMA